MKRHLLFKSLLLLCALVVGSSSAWADDPVTISAKAQGKSNGDEFTTISSTHFSLTFAQQESTNPVKYYNESFRFYKIAKNKSTGASVTIEASTNYNVTAVTLTNGGSNFNASTGTYSNGSWTGTAASVTFYHTNTSSSTDVSSIVVTVTSTVTKKNTELTLDPTSLNLSYGGSTGTLTATVTPTGESALASPTIKWESDDESVATVSGGTVTPVSEGTCTITATYEGDNTYNGSSNTATVTVTDNRTAVVSAITSINSIKTLYIGGKHAFTPDVTLADGLSANDVTYSYVSADPTTIQINDDGTYTALKTGSDIDVTVTVTPIAAKLATYKPVSAIFKHNGAYKYKSPVFTPTGLIGETTNFETSITLAMANNGTPTGPIYYTTNGEDPATDKSNCTLYESDLNFTATTTVKARVIDNDGYYSTIQNATYTKVPLYTVTFDAGSGTCATTSLKEADYQAGVTLPAVTPITGWTFEGWATSKSATSGTEAGETYKPTNNCTLYAIFSKGGFVSETTYTQETTLANVKAATKVVLLNNNYILKSNGTTISSQSKTNLNDITVSDDMIFTLSGDDSNGYTLTNAAGYTLGAETVAASGSGNNNKPVSMTTDNNKWDIVAHNTTGAFVLKSKDTYAALDYYNSTWQTYYNTNYSSNNYTKVYFFVPKVETIYNNQPETDLDITDATDITTLDGAFAEEVTYTRTMGKLSTLYLPYATEVPAGMKAYKFNEADGSVLKFTEVDAIEANKPYVLEQASAASQDFSATNVTIDVDNSGNFNNGDWTLKGTVEQISNADLLTEAGSGKAYIVQTDGKWHPVESNASVYIPAFRAYFICSNPSTARIMDMSLGDGETTQIHLIGNDAEQTTNIYTLDGRFVGTEKAALKKGVYVVNGKKVTK